MKSILIISCATLVFSAVIHLTRSSSQFLVLDPETLNRHSAITSYRPQVPVNCQHSFETIQCYEKCQDDDNITMIFHNIQNEGDKDISVDRLVSIALLLQRDERNRAEKTKGLDNRPGVGIPCENKCQTDPLYWTCVEDCELQDHTTLWETCFAAKFRDPDYCVKNNTAYLAESTCTRCLVQATRKRLESSCEIAHLPNVYLPGNNLCTRMSICNSSSPEASFQNKDINSAVEDCGDATKDNFEMMKLCVNDKIMRVQRDCCHSELFRNASGCRINEEKCDKICMKILSPRLCRENCLRLKSDVISKCVNEQCNFYYSIDDTICAHCFDDPTNNQPYRDYEKDKACVAGCNGSTACVKSCLPYVKNNYNLTRIPQYLIDNCQNKEYIWKFSNFVVQNRGKSHNWSVNVGSSEYFTEWMSFYKTPFECSSQPCNDTELMEELTTAQITDLCNRNPFRTIDVLACAVVQQHPHMKSLKYQEVYNKHFVECLKDVEFENTRMLLYETIFHYETQHICSMKYCSKPGGIDDEDPINHPNAFSNMKCQIHYCQKPGLSPYCEPTVDDFINELKEYPTCRWRLDLSRWESPKRLLSTYFNELPPKEIKYKLEYPDATEILAQTGFEGKGTYYTFPYFVIIRSVCDGEYYTEESYRHMVGGRTPIVQLGYQAPTNRQPLKKIVNAIFQTALISLERSEINSEDLVPENPMKMDVKVGDEVREIGCHQQICYPAFAAPMVFLHMPDFEAIIYDQYLIDSLSRKVYVSQFHVRAATERAELQNPTNRPESTKRFSIGAIPPHPAYLFPQVRSTFAVDTELNYHANCYANDVTDKLSTAYYALKCPELEHTLDDFDNPYKLKFFAPLDPEDIFRSQYTYSTAPTQAVAGFYDPKFILIGDADMNTFDVADWSKLLVRTESESNTSAISCVQFGSFKNRGFKKPFYSQMDRTDTLYPITYFRQRYAPKPYYTSEEASTNKRFADTAIFEAIGLEDRLLLITNKGLISYYGHTNDTAIKDKPLQYKESESLNKCFKIVRVLPSAQPNADLIVGVTYDYLIQDTKHRNVSDPDSIGAYKDIAQEIWVGKFTRAGEEIQWKEIKNKLRDSLPIEAPAAVVDRPKETFAPFKPDKDPGLPHDIRETNPRSQIDAICYKAYQSHINTPKSSRDKVSLIDEENWCVALDATPVQLKEDTIQVLVRMRTYFRDTSRNVPVYFYIVATHKIDPSSADVEWSINSIIPRYPCIDEHREAVSRVNVYDEHYFQSQYVNSKLERGCFEANAERLQFHIFLNGMTYPRALTNHLFLYGSRLLQSTNNGRSLMILKGFPQRFNDYDEYTGTGGSSKNGSVVRDRMVHRIVKMAFDDGGHYAFITNKLELWLGSTGSFTQVRLRPSPLQSMVYLGVSKVRNVHAGVPFTLDFDSYNNLYELVAIVGESGDVTQIVKRPVKHWKLLKAKTMLAKFEVLSSELLESRRRNNTLSDELQTPINYNIPKWSSFCSYVSPALRQNFSRRHSRTQAIFIPHPEQHINWGKTHDTASLLAFQASAFTLIWDTFFSVPERFYASQEKDPFLSWITNRKYAAFATMKTSLFSQEFPSEEHSILIQPLKFKRIVLAQDHSTLIRKFYIDYNITAELELEFSIRHDQSILNTEFMEDQLSRVELNVENSNGSIIQINTEKEVRAQKAAVLFIIRMSVKRKAGLRQTRPGETFVPVPVTYHLIGAFGNCIEDKKHGLVGDSIETLALVGCPINRELVFDWNATLRSFKLRGDRVQPNSIIHGIGTYCHKNEYVCFFARSPVVFHFEVFDETKQRYYPYNGKYIMRIIGGGRTRDDIKLYSQEEIDAFNIVGISDASLIWNEWDPVRHKKVERQSQRFYDAEGEQKTLPDSRENILESGKSVISFVCHTLSPCARIAPTKTLEVVFWFKVIITNRDVDSGTLCLYEKEFDVMMYGFPPSPEFQLLATLGFSCLFMGMIYLVYIFRRQNAKLWKSTKLGGKNWFFIVKDVFPKKLRYYELPLPEEQTDTQGLKKNRVYGSADQGSHDESVASFDDSEGSNLHGSSSTSIGRSASMIPSDSSHIIPRTGTHFAHSAKQIMYDQILSKRLNTIVQRNRTLRENLIKKASIHGTRDDWEQERNFQKQFGRTVSQESGFAPPMPKDRNRGIDSFL